MWRDPLDELIEDLERALPSTPAPYEMSPRMEDLQRMVSVALYGTDEDRARAEKEKWYQDVMDQLIESLKGRSHAAPGTREG